MKPQRIQLSRKSGFNLQAVSRALNGLPAVNCARPSEFGNPYTVAEYGREGAVKQYRYLIEKYPQLEASIKTELRGKNLGCWCKPGELCHADVLLEIANSDGPVAIRKDIGSQNPIV